MVSLEIIIGIVAIAVVFAVFAPLMFDPRGAFDLIDLAVCNNDEILLFNITSGAFECSDFTPIVNATNIQIIQLNRTQVLELSQFDNFEWARASDFNTKGANQPNLEIDTLTNFNVDVIRYQIEKDPNQAAFWTSAIPTAFNSTSAVLDADLYYYKQDTGNDGAVCWGLSWIGIENGTSIDVGFGIKKTICTGEFLAVDTLQVVNFQFNATEHDLSSKEWAVLRLERTTTLIDGEPNPLDTFDQDAFLLGIRIIWESFANQTTGL